MFFFFHGWITIEFLAWFICLFTFRTSPLPIPRRTIRYLVFLCRLTPILAIFLQALRQHFPVLVSAPCLLFTYTAGVDEPCALTIRVCDWMQTQLLRFFESRCNNRREKCWCDSGFRKSPHRHKFLTLNKM